MSKPIITLTTDGGRLARIQVDRPMPDRYMWYNREFKRDPDPNPENSYSEVEGGREVPDGGDDSNAE